MYRCNSCKATGNTEQLDAHCLATYDLTHGAPHYSYRKANLMEKHEWTAISFSWGGWMECTCGVIARDETVFNQHNAVTSLANRLVP